MTTHRLDLTLPITDAMASQAVLHESSVALAGHVGTHFDVMQFHFPLEYSELPGVVLPCFNKTYIDLDDVDPSVITEPCFVAIATGFSRRIPYGEETYFKEHPELSTALVDALIEAGAKLIGIDFAGLRRGSEHRMMDQHCAEQGTFIIENLVSLDTLYRVAPEGRFHAHTYPMAYLNKSGLPCRVIAEYYLND